MKPLSGWWNGTSKPNYSSIKVEVFPTTNLMRYLKLRLARSRRGRRSQLRRLMVELVQSTIPLFCRVLIADRLSLDNDGSSSRVISPASPGDANSAKESYDPWDDIERSLLVPNPPFQPVCEC